MLRSLFATMFVIYNTFIGNMLMDKRAHMYYLTGSIWFFNISIILYTHYDFTDFTYESIVQVVIAVVYTLVLIPAFLYVVNCINSEYLEEANLAFMERNNYKKMFDALQEGIIVTQGPDIVLMNDLSNKLMSWFSGM